jgi:hypothetical protein
MSGSVSNTDARNLFHRRSTFVKADKRAGGREHRKSGISHRQPHNEQCANGGLATSLITPRAKAFVRSSSSLLCGPRYRSITMGTQPFSRCRRSGRSTSYVPHRPLLRRMSILCQWVTLVHSTSELADQDRRVVRNGLGSLDPFLGGAPP